MQLCTSRIGSAEVTEHVIFPKNEHQAKMASFARKRVRYTFDIYFDSQEEKQAFQQRLETLRKQLWPPGSKTTISNRDLFDVLSDAATNATSDPVDEASTISGTKSFMRNSGKFLYLIQYWT